MLKVIFLFRFENGNTAMGYAVSKDIILIWNTYFYTLGCRTTRRLSWLYLVK